VKVYGLNAVAVSAGAFHSCAVLADDDAVLGSGRDGKLGTARKLIISPRRP
jgi:hypothetical protein